MLVRRKDNRRRRPVEIKSGMPDAGPGKWKSTRDERQSGGFLVFSSMYKPYLLVALRVLRRNKAYSLLNIVGLSIGVAASVLIFLVIRWETGYDGYHENKDRVYRVVTDVLGRSNGEIVETHAYAPLGLGDVVRKEMPGLEKVAAVMKYSAWQAHLSAKGAPDQKRLLQKEVMVAEPALFDMLDVEWLEGNASSLSEPSTAVWSLRPWCWARCWRSFRCPGWTW